jgi:predicted small metal-binding protein
MYNLSCKDVSGIECPFVAKGNSEEEVMADLTEHGVAKHLDKIQAMMAEGMTQEQMEDKMRLLVTMS